MTAECQHILEQRQLENQIRLSVRMNIYISDTVIATPTKFSDIMSYCTQIKLILKFGHALFRRHKSI